MKIFTSNGDAVNIKIRAYGEGKFKPLQTDNALDEFDILINTDKITVFYNKSKSNIDYYYLNFEGFGIGQEIGTLKITVYIQLNYMNNEKSLQETYAPNGICFGCGVANDKGLRIRSFETEAGEYVAEWHAEPHHQAFPGMLSGGIIGSLLRLSFKLDGGAFSDEKARQNRTRLHRDGKLCGQTFAPDTV